MAPPFDEYVGGSIVLHKLCDVLNDIGENAYIVENVFLPDFHATFQEIFLGMAVYTYRKLFRQYKANKAFNTPILKDKTVTKNDIVIYPENISGNPLKGYNVVRWFLHKPGFHFKNVRYGDNELYFFYQQAFNDLSINTDLDNLLRVVWVNDCYKQTNFGNRTGICYTVRKGDKKMLKVKTNNYISIDGLQHCEIAAIFNKCKYFVSYDPYTMLSRYAAICGCIPIVVRDSRVSKVEWRKEEKYRLGIAYGFDDIEYAINTRGDLLLSIKQEQEEMYEQVKKFVVKTKNYFINKA